MPEHLTADRPAGLFTKENTPVPLAGVSIDAEISTFCARVVMTQRFVNREATPIEAVYTFPLEERVAVCGFEAVIDGTLVVAEVKEREAAFRTYDEAIEQGHGAYLLDEERPDVFQASVGNLPSGKDVLLRLTYVTELTVERDSLRFSIPTTVSPRYAPAGDKIGVGRPDSDSLNPPVAWRVPYGLDLRVKLTMTEPITRLESPSHPVAVSMNRHEATVTLSQREAALDRDFVLSIEAAGLDHPQAWIEREEDNSEAIAVAFVPTLATAATPSEVIFLVDCSGSMGGTSIAEVRNALQLCLRSMISGCRFDIVAFGSTFVHLFDGSLEYDDSSLAKASQYVTTLEANLGGTEILPALTDVLERPRRDTLARQIVILTDGQVTNTDAVIALARKYAANTRIFTFGIGAGASQHLVRGLARAGGGVAEFIYPGERIEPKVVRQFGRLLSPALTNVCMEWDGADVVQAPSALPPVFSGGRLLLYGFLRQETASAAPIRARLSAETPSGPVTFDVSIDGANVRTGRTVATLAARARICELEESPEWTSARGSRQVERQPSAARQEIIRLSMRYNLISRETSFVAIERRDTPVSGDIQLRRVPVALTSGWGGLDERTAIQWARLSAGLDTMSLAVPGAVSRTCHPMMRATKQTLGMSDWLDRHAVNRTLAVMHALVKLQRADGSWDLTTELAVVIGQKLRDLERALSPTTGDPNDVRRAWATALALAWLEREAHDAEDEWRMLAGKARKWLESVRAVPQVGTAWIAAATTFLDAH